MKWIKNGRKGNLIYISLLFSIYSLSFIENDADQISLYEHLYQLTPNVTNDDIECARRRQELNNDVWSFLGEHKKSFDALIALAIKHVILSYNLYYLLSFRFFISYSYILRRSLLIRIGNTKIVLLEFLISNIMNRNFFHLPSKDFISFRVLMLLMINKLNYLSLYICDSILFA